MAATGPGNAAAGEQERRLDALRLARLRWRCRRGLLENDLLLERFLDARGDAITEREVAQLDALLALPDPDLWDLLSGRAPPDPALAPLVAALLSTPPSRPTTPEAPTP